MSGLDVRAMNECLMTPGRPPRVLFCGSRSWPWDDTTILARLRTLPTDSLVIVGGARGADQIAADAARQVGLHVACIQALWREYGKSAGHRRNAVMLSLLDPEHDWVEAFWDRKSNGTRGTMREAERLGICGNVHYLGGGRGSWSGLRTGAGAA